MRRRARELAARAANRLSAPYMEALGERIATLEARLGDRLDRNERIRPALAEIEAKLAALAAAGDEVPGELAAVRAELTRLREELASARGVLRYVQEGAAENRRRLQELRRSASYEPPFTDPEPLISVIIPTYDRAESLHDRSLPSVLAQTYENFEVVVVGDCSPPQVGQVVAQFDDERIRFYNRTIRGPYPEDPNQRWYVLGTPTYNDAVALARGAWIAGVGDDDSLRPQHLATLLRAAQENRYEHCYGRLAMRYPNGEDYVIGEFPPRLGQFALQSSIYHAGLRYFELEPVDYLHHEPNDFSLCRRMIEAGVRFGMVEAVLADKYETRYQGPADWERGVPAVE